jgi:hypothetical protein
LSGPGYLETTKQFYNNDSVWLDLDFPVMTAPNGTRFKPLFAPLIIDLDSRLNLNVAGNIRGANQSHVSNQGWGPWEINLGLLADPMAADFTDKQKEWQKLFLGNGTVVGRYGPDGHPGRAGSLAQGGPAPHSYARVDFDGCDETNGFGLSAAMQLPTAGGYSPFPTFGAGYGDYSTAERTNHSSLFNVFQPSGGDRVIPASNLEALLRYGDTGSPALTSDLFSLCSTNLSDPRIRNLVTTQSFDLDRPGLSPWVWDPSQQPYGLRAGSAAPVGNPISFPTLSLRTSSPVPQGSDFRIPNYSPDKPSVDWRALYVNFARLNLNRRVTAYPISAGQPFNLNDPTTVIQFQQAQQDRQTMTQDIYVRLQKVTGAYDPFDHSGPPSPEQLNALRWLAQLAVNIVDFVDSDDIMTPFNWGAVGSLDFTSAYSSQWVFGTELPRLVVNEAYAEFVTLSPGPPTVYQVNAWLELLNPLNSDNPVADPNQGTAILQMLPGQAGSYAVYEVAIGKSSMPSSIRDPGNVLGDPDRIYSTTLAGTVPSIVSDFSANPTVLPCNGNYFGVNGANQGFYLLSSTGPFPTGPAPNPPPPVPSLQRPEMSYQVQTTDMTAKPPSPVFLLRRLACPYVPPQSDPTKANYNPYVTVDYVENTPLNDSTRPLAERNSFGRSQPYAAHYSQFKQQQPAPSLVDQPQHSFFRQNAIEQTPPAQPGPNQTLAIPFGWLVHLDRNLISPMELLQVSGFKPHELTQQFMFPGSPFGQRVPWFDEDLDGLMPPPVPLPSHRLWRIFELLETKDLAAGIPEGGQIPGRINLNTIWDLEIFRSICDPQPANNFTLKEVNDVFANMLTVRSPAGAPGPSDRPFLSLAAGYTLPNSDLQSPQGIGINDTFFRSVPLAGAGKSPRLFQVPGNHPYLQDQLMTKIFNNVTNRSNVFAVWLTVGFFEVTDDKVRPVRLGAEVGQSENRHVRHRMFAIVDRSILTPNAGPIPNFDPRADFRLVPYFSIIK